MTLSVTHVHMDIKKNCWLNKWTYVCSINDISYQLCAVFLDPFYVYVCLIHDPFYVCAIHDPFYCNLFIQMNFWHTQLRHICVLFKTLYIAHMHI